MPELKDLSSPIAFRPRIVPRDFIDVIATAGLFQMSILLGLPATP
jgi:hypothetical protein